MNRRGFTLIELLIVVAVIGILAATAIPNVLRAQRRARYSRAASEVRQATTQSMVYGLDHNQYPGTYILSAPLAAAAVPSNGDDVHIYSKGSSGAGTFPSPFVNDTGIGGSVGYSSIYGAWSGS